MICITQANQNKISKIKSNDGKIVKAEIIEFSYYYDDENELKYNGTILLIVDEESKYYLDSVKINYYSSTFKIGDVENILYDGEQAVFEDASHNNVMFYIGICLVIFGGIPIWLYILKFIILIILLIKGNIC